MLSSESKARKLGVIVVEMRKIYKDNSENRDRLMRIISSLGDLYDGMCDYQGERKMKDVLVEKIFDES